MAGTKYRSDPFRCGHGLFKVGWRILDNTDRSERSQISSTARAAGMGWVGLGYR
jgi:hypothetical protein